jgi:hypothetical protein
MATKNQKTSKKNATKKNGKSTEKLRKDAIRSADANIARLDRLDGEALAEGTRAKHRKGAAGAKESKAKGSPRGGKGASGGKEATSKKERDTGQRGTPDAKTKAKANATPKKTSGLDAAAQVLAASKEPLTCKEIVEIAMEKKLWSTGGKTPHATIYSAILREIQKKGKDARFRKADRGRFAANKKGA